MRKLLSILFILTLGSCSKFKTDATSGREFLFRQASTTQYFSGTTQFMGEQGMSFSILPPYVSLETGDTVQGSPEFWLVEYKDAKQMMYGGLPTTSGNYVLGTGGAFKLTTRINEELVRPSKVQFQVPDPTPNSDMRLFGGVINGESTFDWWQQDPLNISGFETTDSTLAGGPGYMGNVSPPNFWFIHGTMHINCDYFLGLNLPLTNILVTAVSETQFSPFQLSVSLLFQNENVYLSGLWSSQDDGYGFINVPIGYEVTGVLVGVDNNEELFYGILDFTIDENGVYPISMQSVTEADLEDILDAL
jgi:hypothetical protein